MSSVYLEKIMAVTKNELLAINAALAADNADLRAEISALRTQLEASKSRYPFVDKLGRRYRMDRNIKCFQPAM